MVCILDCFVYLFLFVFKIKKRNPNKNKKKKLDSKTNEQSKIKENCKEL